MEVIYNDFAENDFINGGNLRLGIALGNFDGVHIGHHALISKLNAHKAENDSVKTCIWTFSEHPLNILKSKFYVPNITVLDEKIEVLQQDDLDYVIFNDFNRVRNMEAEEFIDSVLIDSLKCEYIVCGFNYKFGKGGRGNANLLKWYLSERGIACDIVDPVVYGGEIVSSSLIRSLIKIGDMEKAEKLLGRPFSGNFNVIHGKKMGREIGVPTINQIFPAGHIVPAHGIYACTCEIYDKKYMAVANIGMRPTVNGKFLNMETHIIGFSGDLYDKKIKVNFHKKLRDEEKFSSVELLKEQIYKDIENTVNYLNSCV